MKNKLLRFGFLCTWCIAALAVSPQAQQPMRQYATQSYMRLLADQDPELL